MKTRLPRKSSKVRRLLQRTVRRKKTSRKKPQKRTTNRLPQKTNRVRRLLKRTTKRRKTTKKKRYVQNPLTNKRLLVGSSQYHLMKQEGVEFKKWNPSQVHRQRKKTQKRQAQFKKTWTQEERLALFQMCGKSCFLDAELFYPICSKCNQQQCSCRPSCEALSIQQKRSKSFIRKPCK